MTATTTRARGRIETQFSTIVDCYTFEPTKLEIDRAHSTETNLVFFRRIIDFIKVRTWLIIYSRRITEILSSHPDFCLSAIPVIPICGERSQ